MKQRPQKNKLLYTLLFSLLLTTLTACGGGGDNSANTEPTDTGAGSNTDTSSDTGDADTNATTTDTDTPSDNGDTGTSTTDTDTNTNTDTASDTGNTGTDATDTNMDTDTDTSALTTQAAKIRFLTQATFGPTPAAIDDNNISSAADWLLTQFGLPATYNRPIFERYTQQYPPIPNDEFAGELQLSEQVFSAPMYSFWINAIGAEDQLRQRMAYALSQILVVSNFGGEELFDSPNSIVYYQDLLTQHAFGNFRDLLEAVTYSPAMGHYLTYAGNLKGDPDTGRVPDENYAREILQLFTVGLVALNQDGTVITDSSGQATELYTNKDITGLARVFTGLNYAEEESGDEGLLEPFWIMPMEMYEEDHSTLEKQFLGLTIPANTGGRQSISMALDHIFQNANVAPFISRQLIQRFVTSNPGPAYIERVATAFENGNYLLPNNISVGDNRRGDLKATLAAILMDEEARQLTNSHQAGKLREPVIRVAHWARAFNIQAITPEFREQFGSTALPEELNQQAYGATSVFNFYRPGYIAPGTLSGNAGLTTPELQITNATSITGYTNFLGSFVQDELRYADSEEINELLTETGLSGASVAEVQKSFSPDYSQERALASQPAALVDRLDLLLTYGRLQAASRQRIIDAIAQIPSGPADEGPDGETQRVHQAILMIMTSPEYLVQQ